jgi:hypothetical protein
MSGETHDPTRVPSAPLQPLQGQRPPVLPALPPAQPNADDEIRAGLVNPLKLVDLVLAAPQRLSANVEQRSGLLLLFVTLLVASVLFSVPYGLVLGLDSWWRIAVLFLGSTLICLPSLHVYSTYLGLRATPTQTAVLALSIPASAAIFTCGFAPILGFLRLTFEPESQQISWRDVSAVLLVAALLCGVLQLWRLLFLSRRSDTPWYLPAVWIGWHVVFAYVLMRMAHVLRLGG